MKKIVVFILLPLCSFSQPFSAKEIAGWEKQAQRITIVRDNWGIPHVYGRSDADAVFGLLYAQCEDDFKRVENNYIEKLGRLSEINGEKDLYNDLLIRLVIDSSDAIKDYKTSPAWLKALMNAYADGINFYLYRHPQTRPALLTRFQPWYPLLWTDGSIGAIDVADITVNEIRNFYSGEAAVTAFEPKDADPLPSGSNGFALAPAKTASGNAILYINPHVTFYSGRRCRCRAKKDCMPMARLPGDSSSCTRDSTNTWAGCTRRVIVMWPMRIWKQWKKGMMVSGTGITISGSLCKKRRSRYNIYRMEN